MALILEWSTDSLLSCAPRTNVGEEQALDRILLYINVRTTNLKICFLSLLYMSLVKLYFHNPHTQHGL
jgi:hypothetical protein